MINKQLMKIAKKIVSSYKMIKITDEDFNKLPYELYSATPIYNSDVIKKTGLGVETDYMESKKGFFFATDEDNAAMYANYEGCDVVVFVIKKSLLNKNNIFYDQNDCYTDEYVSLLKGEQYSWQNYTDEDIKNCTAEEYWDNHKYNMCFFYEGIIDSKYIK